MINPHIVKVRTNMKDKVIALDLGGTNIRVAIVDEKLNVLKQIKDKTISDNPSKLMDKVITMTKDCSKEYIDDVKAIGVSICGVVKNNVIGKCGNLSIEGNFPLYETLKKEFKINDIVIANDANCSALVEARFGANKNVDDSIFVTISSGIGTGLVLNKKIVDIAFEGGRQITEYKGEFYETEYLLSGNGIVRLAKMNSLYIESGKEFFDLLKKEDTLAKRVYEIWIRRLALFFSNLQLLFNVEQYALSGGVMLSKDFFLNDLEKISNASISSWKLRPIKLVSAKFGQDVGIMGASSLVL